MRRHFWYGFASGVSFVLLLVLIIQAVIGYLEGR